ncbi:MAG: DUF5107 domain-containing protein [Verrucomicrobia bacterium]|nr:DUF5107 domain-containing protein [Verrucomicrobiota bacterium]MCH8511976.1 DUF5107 domain-containing protein [Kiritimatiellia bacterium]
MSSVVKAWRETVVIPTYAVGTPNPNPMFLEKRVYQGSSGAVYPHPVIERVADEAEPREWTAVFLENAYIRLMILPELGGRLQRATDLTNGYDFIYHNQVIKPALVGLTGPWISGGIEFNWPQHHRPSTYQPLDWCIEEHADGSRTVWCAETERMFRTRGRHGFTLHPDRASFEVRARLHNRTREPQTFLWWANPAVRVNDAYQSVFPPDVHAVMDHGKRDVSDFPIATGVYYKHDYAPGTDISRYRNIPVPTSYMAYHSDYSFVGCYDHEARAGMLHVANPHLVPGKKQWTWGNGEFGRAWDRQLTDEDGPYIELMCGAFTDNQPDFTWIMPGEEKRFTQTFLPYKEIGPPSNANANWALRMDHRTDRVDLGLYAVRQGKAVLELWHNPGKPSALHNHKNMQVSSPHRPLSSNANRLLEVPVALPAAGVWRGECMVSEDFRSSELTLRLLSEDRKTLLLDFTPPPDEKPEIPAPAKAAEPPYEIGSNEELFLTGQHLEQYRHATYAPEPYYEEALRRDPGDSRCHIALGLRKHRRGKFEAAEPHFRAAIDRLTQRNPNPADGEVYYHLGMNLLFQDRREEAFDVLYKAVWSAAWKSPACFELARIACAEGRLDEALDLTRDALAGNRCHAKALHLEVVLLRRLGRKDDAVTALKNALADDPLDPGLLEEARRLKLPTGKQHEPNQAYNLLELGLDYLHAGCVEEAESVLERADEREFLARYVLAWSALRQGRETPARERFAKAASQDTRFAFPNVLECVPVLRAALAHNPEDALAAYALGNFWYAHRQHEEAVDCWEQCVRARPDFPTAWRNLGLARMNKLGDVAGAEEALERAAALDPRDARLLYELDQFHSVTGGSVENRLARLDRQREQVMERDDLCVAYMQLLNLSGRAAEALEILTSRTFHPWEGGEGKTPACYQRALFLLADQALAKGDANTSLRLLDQAGTFPRSLGEGKLSGNTDNERHYRRGLTLAHLGRTEEAAEAYRKATQGISEPASALYYNDQPPETLYVQGLAWKRLGENTKAEALFNKLLAYGKQHEQDKVTLDYFAVSLPDFLVFDIDLSLKNRRHCLFMQALGLAGMGQKPEARHIADTLLKEVPDHPIRLLRRVW